MGFDTSLIGTPESYWDTLELYPWYPAVGELIVVAPHPDDETLGAGGLIYTWAQRQLPITIISMTDGEAACPEVVGLASVRHRELRRALRSLSATLARLTRLGIPDGRAGYCRAYLAESLRSAISDDATIVAPFERDGHPDHDVAGEVAREIARQSGVHFAAYPIWAWHQATPAIFSGRPIVSFSLTHAAQMAKQQAIQCYASQLRERPGGPIIPPHMLPYFSRPYEVFVL
jgi:LmbE family N-acetylglucosaminyl deacetylase